MTILRVCVHLGSFRYHVMKNRFFGMKKSVKMIVERLSVRNVMKILGKIHRQSSFVRLKQGENYGCVMVIDAKNLRPDCVGCCLGSYRCIKKPV